ncbi:hypothetical protein AYI68_g5002 [Smittium mucronatum]|uniref:Phorbol-ester/DAG-type domain-containing protein n=1 Tax=Smittium mucronatum TaxID=133383 RepID=A0A1R0GVF8_9FUNG|nr:hypothetical protein AYI68_g5002 [Smittium mucronatum]
MADSSQHHFINISIASASHCSFCKSLVWGLLQSSEICDKCGYFAHAKCVSKVTSPCSLTTAPESPNPRSGNDLYIKRLKRDFSNELATQKVEVQKIRESLYPELNTLSAMPRNFKGFIEKTGPLVIIDTFVKDLFFWKSYPRTIFTMLVFSLYCYRPQYIFLSPALVSILYILHCLNTKSSKRKKHPQPSDIHHSDPTYIPTSEAPQDCEKSIDVKPSSYGNSMFPVLNYSMYQSIFSFRKSNDYNLSENLRFNQNVTGMYLDAYQSIESYLNSMDWESDPQAAKNLLIMLSLVLAAQMVVFYFIPISLLIWSLGMFVFLSNCPLLRAFLFSVLIPELKYYFSDNSDPISDVATQLPLPQNPSDTPSNPGLAALDSSLISEKTACDSPALLSLKYLLSCQHCSTGDVDILSRQSPVPMN